MEKVLDIMEKELAFYSFTLLYIAISEYEFNQTLQTLEKLKDAINTIDTPMPLPSGRWGNALAVALEMFAFKSAQFMIQNANVLGIDLYAISSDKDGRNEWSGIQSMKFLKTTKDIDGKINDIFAFCCFVSLNNIIDKYFFIKNNTFKNLKSLIKSISVPMPLPSGRWGSALAVALEMHEYKSAQFMIQNASTLGIDLTTISSEKDGKNVWSAKQVFEYSKGIFEVEKKIIDKKRNTSNDHPDKFAQFYNDNIMAFHEIDNLFKRTRQQ